MMLEPNSQLANTNNSANTNVIAGPLRPSDNGWQTQNHCCGPSCPNPNNIPLLQPQPQTLFHYGFVPNATQLQPVNNFFNPGDYVNNVWQ